MVPIGYGNAAELLRFLRGVGVPRGWQGGLAFHYHVGPGPVKARVTVRDDRATSAIKPIYDTFAMIRGSQFPELVGICNRVVVMREGRLVGEFEGSDVSESALVESCYAA